MEKIKINFGHFWNDFVKNDNMFTRALSKKYEVEISEHPDFYFFTYSYNGKCDYLKYNCHRIFLGWENERANWNICDYVLDSDFYIDNPRHKRYPLWAAWNIKQLIEPKNLLAFAGKKKFCCMVVSNSKAKERIEFFHKLSKYKKVDSAGRYLNNIGYAVDNKMDFIRDYKFVISFENSSYPGYTTEKLIQPMFANSIPIYWGNTMVGKDFNTKSFININDFTSYDEAIEYIIKLDNEENAFMEMAVETWFNNNRIPDEFSNESFLDFFDFVIKDSKTKKPVARSIYKNYMHRLNQLRIKVLFAISQKFK